MAPAHAQLPDTGLNAHHTIDAQLPTADEKSILVNVAAALDGTDLFTTSDATFPGDVAATGDVRAGSTSIYMRLHANGLEYNDATWSYGTTHQVLKRFWTSDLKDALYIAAPGNQAAATDQAMILSENAGCLFGKGHADGNQLTTTYTVLKNGKMQHGASPRAYPDSHMTQGIALCQGGYDDNILSFQSTDVAHGITTKADTTVYAQFRKYVTSYGGLKLTGLCDGGSTGLHLNGNSVSADTSTSTISGAAVEIDGWLKSGTTSTALGSTANILAVKTDATTRLIVKGDGDLRYDGTASAYDDYQDGLLAHDLAQALSQQWHNIICYNRDALVDAGVLFPDDEAGTLFVSQKRLNMLTLGALGQAHLDRQRLWLALQAAAAEIVRLGGNPRRLMEIA